MAYLKEITGIINDALIARALSTERFVGKKLHGIAVTVNRNKTGAVERMPLLTNNSDDEIYVGYDDTFPITVYHKTLTISRELNREQSYGDPIDVITETANMQMIVYADRKKIKMTPEQLDALLVDSFPIKLTKTQVSPFKLRSVIITPSQTNFNSAAIYSQEYSAESRMKPNDIFIAINYTVQSSFKVGCLELCEC